MQMWYIPEKNVAHFLANMEQNIDCAISLARLHVKVFVFTTDTQSDEFFIWEKNVLPISESSYDLVWICLKRW